MELKILKQEVSVNSEIFKAAAEHSIDLEITIPEYFPKIAKILKCKATPNVSNVSINGQILSAEGSVHILLLYNTEQGEIFSYEYIMPFSRNFECENDTVNGSAFCKAEEEYINCRLTADNKVELHGAIGLKASIVSQKSESVITDIDGGCVMQKHGNAPATTPVGSAQKYMNVEEELELSGGQPSVNNIIRYCVKAVNSDCKIIGGKVAVKGEMRVFVLYCGEHNQAPQTFSTTIPYSQIMDVAGITDECECECETEVCALEIKPRTAVTGEARTLSLNAKLRFCANVCCNNDIPVVYDAFSTKYESKINTDDVVFEKIFKTVNDNFVARNRIELSNAGIGNVIDMWCEPKVTECKAENGEMKVSGNMQICMLAYDTADQPVYVERTADFEYQTQIEKCETAMKCDAKVSENKLSYTIISNNCIEITAELTLNATVYTQSKVSLVKSIELDENKPKCKDKDIALIIYYAQPGDNLWEIARQYNSSPDEIAEINSLESNVIASKKTLLIPVK